MSQPFTLTAEQIQRFIPFDELPVSIIHELLPHFRAYSADSKKLLFKRGSMDEECHFLLSGTVDLADQQFHITTITGEDEANFLALDASHPIHRMAAITQSECQLFAIRRAALELITTWAELRQSWTQADAESDWLETLLTSGVFSRIPPANIQKLLSRFQARTVSLGECILTEGEEGDECYVIKRGKALVTRMNGSKQEKLAALSHGALFGEDALISNLPRNATVTMSSDGILMTLTKEDFNTLLKQPVLDYLSEDELAMLIANGETATIMLDVRSTQEAIANPIHRAQGIPLAQLRSHLNELSHEFLYVVIGEGRAEAAAYILSEAGFNVRVLQHQ